MCSPLRHIPAMERLSLHSWLDALSSHPIFKSSGGGIALSSSLPPSPNQSSIFGDDFDLSRSNAAVLNAAAARVATTSACCIARKTELLVAVGSKIRALNLANYKAKYENGQRDGSVNDSDDVPSTPTGRYSKRHRVPPAASTSSASSGSYKVGWSCRRKRMGRMIAELLCVKTLYTPTIDFDILTLIPSPSSRFLAAVGRSQVVVLELPRKGWDGLVGSTLECR